LVDAGERPIPIATEQVVSPPAKGRGDGAERAIEKTVNVLDKWLPTHPEPFERSRVTVGIEQFQSRAYSWPVKLIFLNVLLPTPPPGY
jgi:hypothetical protein